MDYDEKHDELESSSSLRTQLIEAQILDSRLEGKESDTHGSSSHHNESLELIASDYTNNISDNTVNENSVALKEIDDTIVRLQEWHLKREFNKKEREEDMLKSIDFEKEQVIEADLDISLNENNEDDIEGISRNVKRDRAKASLATVEALLQRKYLPNHIVDLSRLADQDLLMKKNLMILEVYMYLHQIYFFYFLTHSFYMYVFFDIYACVRIYAHMF